LKRLGYVNVLQIRSSHICVALRVFDISTISPFVEENPIGRWRGESLGGVSFAASMANMLAKILASSIVVLILLPFTAPFSTCDLASPLAHRSGQSMPFGPRRASAATTDTATVLLPARVTTGRGSLIRLVGPHLEYVGPGSPVRVGRFADSTTSPQRLGAFLTILRL